MKKKFCVILIAVSAVLTMTACSVKNEEKIARGQEVVYKQMNGNAENENYFESNENRNITALFTNSHEEQKELTEEFDLDGNGDLERITLTNLKYNGGDGGYELQVYRKQNDKELELPMPKSYVKETGFPFFIRWDGENMEVYADDKCIKTISLETLQEIYKKQATEEDLERALGKPDNILGDAVSGFRILQKENGDRPVLLTKTYLSGVGGHSDCIGYGITELQLSEDDNWTVNQYFVFNE